MQGVEALPLPARRLPLPAQGTLEALKWLALGAMLVDHVGALVFGHAKGDWSYHVGRTAFPLFAFVLGTRLALRTVTVGPVRAATVLRLALWGLACVPVFWAATGRWWPPNIFFTLALGAALCWLHGWQGPRAARIALHALIALLSFGCDYFAPGVYLTFAVFLFVRRAGPGPGIGLALCAAGLAFLNHSLATLVPFALAALAPFVALQLPPWRWFFYFFYPAHLAAIAAWVHWR